MQSTSRCSMATGRLLSSDAINTLRRPCWVNYLVILVEVFVFFFFKAEDGIRDHCVTGFQTCALPIYRWPRRREICRRDCAARRHAGEISRQRAVARRNLADIFRADEAGGAFHVLDDDARLAIDQPPDMAYQHACLGIGRAARGEVDEDREPFAFVEGLLRVPRLRRERNASSEKCDP